MKYQKICAVVCLFCLAAFSGCSPNEPEKRPLQSFPIVVASDPASSSGATGHSHNCKALRHRKAEGLLGILKEVVRQSPA